MRKHDVLGNSTRGKCRQLRVRKTLVVKRSFVCGYTDKVKPLGNEQYCKHFEKECVDIPMKKILRDWKMLLQNMRKASS